MPNWAEGNIRIRGKRENLIRFLKNVMMSLYEKKSDEVQKAPTEPYVVERPITLTETQGGWSLILTRDEDTNPNLYFRGSRRQFIFDVGLQTEIYLSEGPNQNVDQIIILDNFNGAWDVDHEIFKKYAEDFKIDIRIFVWERGMEWSSIYTWHKNGQFEQESKTYENWLWDCPMPFNGG